MNKKDVQSRTINKLFCLSKILRIMKLTSFLLIISVLEVFATDTYSQATRLSMDLGEATVEQVLKEIENHSEFHFLFNQDLVDVSRTVQGSFQDQQIGEILASVFKSTDVDFYVMDRQIILSPREYLANVKPMQPRAITGTITDENGNPIIGATIVVKGTTVGTISNEDGVFQMDIPDNAESLQFSFVGMNTQEVVIGNQSVFNITLSESSIGLDEVVVIGYGTMKKSSLTASVATLRDEKLSQVAVGRADLAIKGMLPGVSVSQTSTRPGDAPIIRIRGISSITGVNDPLYVVDGVPIGGDLGSINSGDIESIEVLKDASSAAIYGSRAAAGVVLITTKRGTGAAPVFNVNAYFGVKTPAYLVDDYHNAQDAFDYSYKMSDSEWRLAGGDPDVPVWERPPRYRPDSLYLNLGDTDWQDELLRNALIQNYELSSSGGNDKIKYYISGNYMDEQSVYIVGSYKRISARANLDVQVSKKLDLGITISPSYSIQRRQEPVMADMCKYPPYIPVYLPNGEIGKDGSRYAATLDFFTSPYITGKNPVAESYGTKDMYYKLGGFSNLFLNYEIIKNLRFRTSLAFDYQTLRNPYFLTTYATKAMRTEANVDYVQNLNTLNENTLNYTASVNRHFFDVLVGNSFQKNTNYQLSMSVQDGSIPNNKIETLNAGIVNNGSTFIGEWGLISYFGRVNYAFADKYLLSVSYRQDGSSRFGEDRKWGAFPSASIGWRVTQESFMQNQDIVSNLKLRMSYGLTGRTPAGLYDPIARIQQGFNYTLGNGDGSKVIGSTQGTFGNTELGWEKTKEFDFGIDLGFFGGRISLISDIYSRLTTDLLLDNPIPGITGFTSTTTNIGEVSNKGIEFLLNTRNLVGEFKWETSLVYAKNINRVESLGDLTRLPLVTSKKGMWFLTEVGRPIGLFYGYKQTGVWESQADLDANPFFPGSKPGSIRVADVNEDGVIDQNDRVILGDNKPDFEFGITNSFSYKNFDLSCLINGVIGFDVWNMELSYYRENRHYVTDYQWFSEEDIGNGWTPANRDGVDPRDTDFYIEDGSYWAIRNVNLGYTIPNHVFMNNLFGGSRIYFAILNLYVHKSKDFHSYNPEGLTDYESEATRPGVNFGSEPLSRTYTVGINLVF
jgi:TonB-linked SusC/RagA family outer membrane protein